MSWLAQEPPPRTLGDALAVRPALLERYRALVQAVDASVDAALLAACRARVRVLTGHAAAPAVAEHVAVPDAAAAAVRQAAIEFTEQLVLDPHGVDDALVARLRALLPVGALVALAQGVAVFEGQCRLARTLGVAPEL